MNWRISVIGAAVSAMLAGGAAFAIVEIGKRQFSSPGPLESAVFFEIPKGAGAAGVAADLVAGGIIDSSGLIPADLVFREGAKLTGRATSIRYGTFDIPAAASMDQILEIITAPEAGGPRFRVQLRAGADGGKILIGERRPGSSSYTEILAFSADEEQPQTYRDIVGSEPSVGYWVSVPEGLTSWQIQESLKFADFLTGDGGETLPEGSLAPDTYSVHNGLDRKGFLDRMQAAQREILAAEWSGKSENLPISSPEEALILASIIEKETGLNAERGLVASVFVNRLREGMPLQTDPSVIYGLTGGKGPLGRGLRRSELKKDTVYNTYLHKGLPPSPIANPGKLSIRAALNPDDSDFFFFVADGKGGHVFSATYREHRKYVREWRKIEASASTGD